MKKNIALIGMAGVGKSHTSRALAKHLGFSYIEVDNLILRATEAEGRDKDSLTDEEFTELEGRMIHSLQNKEEHVIDTGGSVIYSAPAMDFLKENAFVVYLADDIARIKQRFIDRGAIRLIGMKPEMTFEELYAQRVGRYEQHADVTFLSSEFAHVTDLARAIANAYRGNISVSKSDS